MKTILFILLLSFSLNAQERVLLHIDRNGQQEAIPLKKGEHVQDGIKRIEKVSNSDLYQYKPAGLIDTLQYFPNDAALNTNFGFLHQDVALQWYTPAAGGVITEFWWRNYEKVGNIRKATIRAWLVNPKISTRPANVITKHLGFYKDPNDSDGNVTPFKPASGDQWFYSNGLSDSSTWNFDPLENESPWKPGGIQVTLDSNSWQGIKLSDWGAKFGVELGQHFGFTLSNDSKIPGGITIWKDIRMELLSLSNPYGAPYHSYKFYEKGKTNEYDKGWFMRGDFDWGMYVVIDYCTDRYPTFTITRVPPHSIKVEPKKIDVYFSGFTSCIYNDTTVAMYLKFKNRSTLPYDSTLMTTTNYLNFSGTIPAFNKADTVFYHAVAVGSNGKKINSTMNKYQFFNPMRPRLFIYNNAQLSISNALSMYAGNDALFDRWSAPNDGIGFLSEILPFYNEILLVDGSFPARNLNPAIIHWLDSGTPTNKKKLFFSSQDYGCYIQAQCADTTFPVGSFEEKYLGIATLGPQDQGPSNRPFKLVPQKDVATNYVIQYNIDSATSLWHQPNSEFAFNGYPDFLTATNLSKALFKDTEGKNVLGVRKDGEHFNTMFMAFDIASLQFRSDTSISPANDPKYKPLREIKSLAVEFFQTVTLIEKREIGATINFSLNQNYPNPFNPSTTIEYSIPVRSSVNISIYNTLGQNVATIVNETKEAGSHSATFNAQSLASGVYFYKMYSGNFMNVKKMLLMK